MPHKVSYSDNLTLWVSKKPNHFIVKKPFTVTWDGPRGLMSFTVNEGFETDLASIPKILKLLFPRVFPKYGKSAQAAIAHDWIYTGHVRGMPKEEADLLFKCCLELTTMPEWKVRAFHVGVRIGGKGHWG